MHVNLHTNKYLYYLDDQNTRIKEESKEQIMHIHIDKRLNSDRKRKQKYVASSFNQDNLNFNNLQTSQNFQNLQFSQNSLNLDDNQQQNLYTQFKLLTQKITQKSLQQLSFTQTYIQINDVLQQLMLCFCQERVVKIYVKYSKQVIQNKLLDCFQELGDQQQQEHIKNNEDFSYKKQEESKRKNQIGFNSQHEVQIFDKGEESVSDIKDSHRIFSPNQQQIRDNIESNRIEDIDQSMVSQVYTLSSIEVKPIKMFKQLIDIISESKLKDIEIIKNCFKIEGKDKHDEILCQILKKYLVKHLQEVILDYKTNNVKDLNQWLYIQTQLKSLDIPVIFEVLEIQEKIQFVNDNIATAFQIQLKNESDFFNTHVNQQFDEYNKSIEDMLIIEYEDIEDIATQEKVFDNIRSQVDLKTSKLQENINSNKNLLASSSINKFVSPIKQINQKQESNNRYPEIQTSDQSKYKQSPLQASFNNNLLQFSQNQKLNENYHNLQNQESSSNVNFEKQQSYKKNKVLPVAPSTMQNSLTNYTNFQSQAFQKGLSSNLNQQSLSIGGNLIVRQSFNQSTKRDNKSSSKKHSKSLSRGKDVDNKQISFGTATNFNRDEDVRRFHLRISSQGRQFFQVNQRNDQKIDQAQEKPKGIMNLKNYLPLFNET